jgi:ribonuclease PH
MIGRSLRAGFDLRYLDERTVTVDCDVIQADGGTRTAAITGGYVAIAMALSKLVSSGAMKRQVFRPPVAAVSAGIVQGDVLLDLCYEEDSQAEVDFNVVMNAKGHYVEIQGTAEGIPFDRGQMDALLDVAQQGIEELLAAQREALGR